MDRDALEEYSSRLRRAREEIQKVIYGQDEVIDLVLTSLISGGHILLVGVPGLAKTRLVEVASLILGLESKRIQCTPDLMPADITGSEVLDNRSDGRRQFRFIQGPIFCQLLMVDEINRASPRTQSALLQAMQEHKISVLGESHALPSPFHVLATQNPLEYEGTFPLPEAQLDRFLVQITMTYPDQASERRMMITTTGIQNIEIERILVVEEMLELQTLIRALPIGESVVDGILRLVRHGREEEIHRHLSWGPGPRASQAFMLLTRAYAFLQGRLSPCLDDVVTLAKPILRHRMSLDFRARAEGISLDDLIETLCRAPFLVSWPSGLSRAVEPS